MTRAEDKEVAFCVLNTGRCLRKSTGTYEKFTEVDLERSGRTIWLDKQADEKAQQANQKNGNINTNCHMREL